MAKIHISAICFLVVGAAPALAADLDAFPPAPAVDQQFVAETSGWYLRGDLGVSFASQPEVSFDPNAIASPPPATVSNVFGANATRAEFDSGVGIGYRFTEHFRIDGTFDFRMGPTIHNVTPGIICPYEARGIYSTSATGTQTPLGVAYDTTETCNGTTIIKQKNLLTLFNGYYDIGTYYGFTPYVGAGVGFNEQQTSGSLTFNESANGSSYAPDLTAPTGYPLRWVYPNGTPVTPPPNIAFTTQNWNRTFSQTKFNFAWALMAGVSYNITPELALDLSYRYANLGSTTVGINAQTGATISQRNSEQDVRIGVRLMAD
jgi:opacity protein-like surface antigen